MFIHMNYNINDAMAGKVPAAEVRMDQRRVDTGSVGAVNGVRLQTSGCYATSGGGGC